MDKIIIQGGPNPLVGSVKIEGAKMLFCLACSNYSSDDRENNSNQCPGSIRCIYDEQCGPWIEYKSDFEQEENRITVDAAQPLSEEAPINM